MLVGLKFLPRLRSPPPHDAEVSQQYVQALLRWLPREALLYLLLSSGSTVILSSDTSSVNTALILGIAATVMLGVILAELVCLWASIRERDVRSSISDGEACRRLGPITFPARRRSEIEEPS